MIPNIKIEPGENIVIKLRKHWMILLRDTAGTLVLGLLPVIVVPLILATIPSMYLDTIGYGSIASFGSALWFLIVWMALFVLWTDYYLDLWIVTNKRIVNIDQVGLFNRQIATWGLDKVQEITVKTENIVQHFFGYGSIEIQTAGPTDEYAKAEGIPNPEKARNAILRQLGRTEELEITNKKQESLLHVITHEVKSYLTKNEAALATISEGDLGAVPAKVKNMADSALSETRRGVDTVTDILDASNFKTGTMQLEKKSFDVRKSVEEIASEIRPSAEKKGLKFEVDIAGGSYACSGDEAKLRRHVFRNLIDNAIHYTARGTIRVLLTHTSSNIVFSVRDTGVGITPEDMKILFTEGGKGKNSSSVNPESTGYGLYVAKSIVEAHDGKIGATSEGYGKGAQFFVELPAA
ncbi:MAG: multi-sensor signal transduction histidine kinase [Parcubacteria group bacterium Gr01-1014_8]|nr:MAG: multi-sensor signal transduction histidine kinase [Parcubacteria group bacterium Gr01-1014_8]